MTAPAISGDALAQKPTLRMPHFKYTGPAKVLMSVDVDMDAELLIVGQPENGAYEWVIVNHGKIEKHSDCGYGQVSIALRDGLIAYHGLTQVQDAAPDLLEALRSIVRAADSDIHGSLDCAIASGRAALAKAGA